MANREEEMEKQNVKAKEPVELNTNTLATQQALMTLR